MLLYELKSNMIELIKSPLVLFISFWFILATNLRVLCSPLNIDQYNLVNSDDFMEGDIRVRKSHFDDPRKSTLFAQRRYHALSEPSAKWTNAEVPYTYDEQEFGPGFLPQLTAAIQEIESKTCIRFRLKTPYDRFYLVLRNADGCWSYVGRRIDMNGQETSLDPRCWQKGIIVHELLHVLGFFHEHSRYDRDNFVVIDKSNIEPTRLRQFEKREPDEVDLLGHYDFGSIMHYERNAFAINRLKPTIIPRVDSVVVMGQRVALSEEDVIKINRLYDCSQSTGSTGEQTLLQLPSTPKTVTPVPWGPWPAPFNPLPPVGSGVNGGFGIQGGVDGNLPTSNQRLYPTCMLPSQAQCEDIRMDCPDMARLGMCERKPGLMLTQCRRTCCNCDSSRCFDTTDQNKFNTLCTSTFTFGFASRSACDNPLTAFNAQAYCPKTCRMC